MIQQTILAVLLASCTMAVPYGASFNHHRVVQSMVRPAEAAPVQHVAQQQTYQQAATPVPEAVSRAPIVPIVRLHASSDDNGGYAFSYESADGTTRQEKGDVRPAVNPEAESDVAQVMEGTVSWTSPEGVHFNLRYVADENGYRAVGDHLPTPPPTPDHVIKALKEIELARANEAAVAAQQQQQNVQMSGKYNGRQTMTRGGY